MANETFSNQELAAVFSEIAALLEIKGENIYKTLAYRKAADSLNNLGYDVNDIWREGKLNEIPGVGKAIAEKIDELLSTGHLKFLENLEREVPPSLIEEMQVPDLGPKRIALFWRELGITNLAELEAAAREGKLRNLPGMGEKSEAKVLAGLEALARRSDRMTLGRAWPAAQELLTFLRQQPGVVHAELGGSLRRMRETIGDIDIVVAAPEPDPVMDAYIQRPDVVEVIGTGEFKSSVEFEHGLRSQLWVQPPERWGTAWVYATGSRDHNIHLRELALDRGLSLSERGFLRKDNSEILCQTEEEVYHVLDLPWIPPEIREDRGEIEAAQANALPHLIELQDLKAELHAHTVWSDGTLTVRQLAEAAIQHGYRTLAITDHSEGLGIVNGLTPARLKEQRAEIDAVQHELGDAIHLLQGSEVEIRADGTLAFPDEVLETLDIVIASLHVSLRQPREQVTRRLVTAIQNPHVDLIGHPSGRIIPGREGADLDMEEVLSAAAESGVALEINAHPSRLDLRDVYARRAVELGIPLSINTDAHSAGDMDMAMFGVATARRGWVTPDGIINTWKFDRLQRWLKNRG